MEDIYVDIRNESDTIKNQFLTCDVVSISRLLERIEELVDEKEKLKNELKEHEPDEYEKFRDWRLENE